MSDLIFLLAVHNHQPVGNFPSVLERAFSECYLPFLRQISSYPSLKFSLHFSGPLWEYMEINQPEAWELIQIMAERKQVELLGGGFYEPILTIIPEWDRQGQLRLMNDYLEEKFRVKAQGAWLAERVWEPQLAKTLAQAGYKYTLLDEEHFLYAGIMNPRFPYLTEDEGCPLVIFPIDKKLRYLIPFRSLDEIKAYFQEIKDSGGLAILGDDGEKFGLWPGTKKWVYEDGWLNCFLDYLSHSATRTMTLSEFLATKPSLNLVYIPPASYEEMMEWILEPADFWELKELKKNLPLEFRRLLRGGFFREFFLKYPESNHLHKRMLYVSQLIQQKEIQEIEVRKELFQSQCNDAYWHGVFGGLYLPHLRQAVFYHLLEAEKKAGVKLGWEKIDYDFDGKDELFYRAELFNLLLKPSSGGSLVEIDFRPFSRNLNNGLTRRPESYHYHPQDSGEGKSIHERGKKLPENYKAYLRYDSYPRRSLLDHFLPPGTKIEEFKKNEYKELGDFIHSEYKFLLKDNKAHLEREGVVRTGEEERPLRVEKEIIPQQDGIAISYKIINLGDQDINFLFGNEWNFYLLAHEWQIESNRLYLFGNRIAIEFLPEPEFWSWPIETLSQSEESYDIIFQGLNWLPHWAVFLQPGQQFLIQVNFKFKNET